MSKRILRVFFVALLLSACGGGAATPSADAVQTAIAQTVVASSAKAVPTSAPAAVPTSAPVATQPGAAPAATTLANLPTKAPTAKPVATIVSGNSSSGATAKTSLTSDEDAFLSKAYNALKGFLAAMDEFNQLNTDLFNDTSLLGNNNWRTKINASLDRVRAASYTMSHIDPVPAGMTQINIKLNQLDTAVAIFLGHYVNGFNQKDIYLLKETENDVKNIQNYYDQLMAEVMKVLPDSAQNGQPVSGAAPSATRAPAAKATIPPSAGAQPKATLPASAKTYMEKVAQIAQIYNAALSQFDSVLTEFENNESVLTDAGWKQRAKAASDTMDKAIAMLNDLGTAPPGLGLLDLNLRSVVSNAGIMLGDFSAGVNMNSAGFMQNALSDLKSLKTAIKELNDELAKIGP